MIKILNVFFCVVSFLYPYKLHQKLTTAKNLLYTLWIKNFLGSVGEHSIIQMGCRFLGGGYNRITIGYNTKILKNSIIECITQYYDQLFSHSSLKIGNNCTIGEYNHITACKKIVIGNGFLSGRFVIITDNNHGGLNKKEARIEPAKREITTEEVIIGDNVWLGDKVSILAGVHIGNNVIVGANAVVTKDIPDNCLAVGVPAKVVKKI
ncbi:MAG: acyltransferase [Bacteroidales bacterium]|nr:acyltransferase [Bacteroidales bacterium]